MRYPWIGVAVESDELYSCISRQCIVLLYPDEGFYKSDQFSGSLVNNCMGNAIR